MAERKRIWHELNLDEEDLIVSFTDAKGRRRRFKVITSGGLIEYRIGGRRYLRLMLEEIE